MTGLPEGTIAIAVLSGHGSVFAQVVPVAAALTYDTRLSSSQLPSRRHTPESHCASAVHATHVSFVQTGVVAAHAAGFAVVHATHMCIAVSQPWLPHWLSSVQPAALPSTSEQLFIGAPAQKYGFGFEHAASAT